MTPTFLVKNVLIRKARIILHLQLELLLMTQMSQHSLFLFVLKELLGDQKLRLSLPRGYPTVKILLTHELQKRKIAGAELRDKKNPNSAEMGLVALSVLLKSPLQRIALTIGQAISFLK